MAIPSDVRNFLARYIDSAELLDILMVVHREPEGHWTPETVSSKVFTVPQAAERRLEELSAKGLVEKDADRPGAYRLKVDDPQTERVLATLREEYDRSRAEVINTVFTLKSDPIKSFSDAFKLRGGS